MIRIYAATTNAGKLREFAECARGEEANNAERVEVWPLPGLEGMPVPVEDAITFMGNAELKARAYSRALTETCGPGLLVMADDSGLEVEALNGRPGVYSARFAERMGFGVDGVGADGVDAKGAGAEGMGSGALQTPGSEQPDPGNPLQALGTDARNNACLLSLLRQLPGLREGRSTRSARFVCALAVARDGEVVLRAEGDVMGEVLMAPRGANGFGYDPLFLLPEWGMTMAELPMEQKWSVSHRGRAFRELLGEVGSL